MAWPEGYGLTEFEEIDSTNEKARRLGEAGAPMPQWLRADKQSAGRGRQGRKWEDATGNLLCTLLLDPKCAAPKAAELSFVTGLAVADAVDALTGTNAARLKWPNDVLIDGAKVSGMLLETASAQVGEKLPWLAIGIGINLAWAPDNTPYPAAHLGGTATPSEALEALATSMDARLNEWRLSGFGAVRKAWLARAHNLGQEITARLPGEEVTGTFTGLHDDGALSLTLADGTKRAITAGDVFF